MPLFESTMQAPMQPSISINLGSASLGLAI
jgi:hypothetical protein